ncbi:MAG: FtsX-like permease family protein [Clostridiales bacterium]|nr:FtsX-like permease family protein [Clostridiales bacterium]
MKRYLDLVPISARVRKRQSRMTRICIILAVSLVTVIFGMADMEVQSQKLGALQTDGGWHAMFSSIDEEQAALISARPQVKNSSWYGVTNYRLDIEYSIDGIQTAICGFDEEFMEMFPAARLIEGSFPTGTDEVALMASAKERLNLQIGDSIQLSTPDCKDITFTIAGFTEDTSLLTKADALGIIMNIATYSKYILKDSQSENLAYYVEFSPYCRIRPILTDIREQLNLSEKQVQENIKLLGLMGQSDDSYIFSLYRSAAILMVLVVIAGVLMIAGSLNSNVVQRTQFFGMLRCLGASKKQIIRVVRLEALNWCKTAIPIGIIVGTFVIWVLCELLKVLSPGYFESLPALGISLPGIFAGVCVGIVTVLLSALSPAKRAARVSPLTAVSGNVDSEQLAKKEAKTRFLRVETALGIHHAISSKKNFILMVGSFAFSIILFLSFTPAVDFLNHAIRPLRPYTPDISIVSADNTCSVSAQLLKQLEENPAVKRLYGRKFAYKVPATVNGQQVVVNLISYEKYQFAWAKEELLEGDIEDGKSGSGVLTVYDAASPLQLGSALTLNLGTGEQQLTVAGVLSNSPFSPVEGEEIVICSEEMFRQFTGETGYTILDIQLNRDTANAEVADIRELAGENVTFSDRRMQNAEARGAYYSFAVFIYGFLAVIALIAVFNIINSIGMSVSARLKQYGAMRAIGMSNRQAIRMIKAETFTYILFGVIVGGVIGLTINKLLFEKMVTMKWGTPWYVPLVSISIIVLVTALSSIAAVYYPAKRIRKLSIVDTIVEY